MSLRFAVTLSLAVALVVGNSVDAAARTEAEPESSLVTRIVPLSTIGSKKAFRFLIGIKNLGKNISRLVVGRNLVVRGYSYPTGPRSGAASSSMSGSVDGPPLLRHAPIDGEQYCETLTNRDFIVGIPSGGEIFLMGRLDLSSVPDGRHPLQVRLDLVTLTDSTTECAEVRYVSSKANIPIVVNGGTLHASKPE